VNKTAKLKDADIDTTHYQHSALKNMCLAHH